MKGGPYSLIQIKKCKSLKRSFVRNFMSSLKCSNLPANNENPGQHELILTDHARRFSNNEIKSLAIKCALDITLRS